jgi:hypothetical protein
LAVAANALTGGSLPATVATVADQQALQIPVTGTYVDTVTFSVAANGVTSIVLS